MGTILQILHTEEPCSGEMEFNASPSSLIANKPSHDYGFLTIPWQISDSSKLKEFAYDNSKYDENGRKFSKG